MVVGAIAVEAISHIAVVAQHTEARREMVAAQPAIEVPANGFSMFRAAAVDMVYSQKFYGALTAARTFATISINDFLTQFQERCFRAFFAQLWIAFTVSASTFMLFTWISLIVSTLSGQQVFSILLVAQFTVLTLIGLFAWLTPAMQAIFAVFATLEKLRCSWISLPTFGAGLGFHSSILWLSPMWGGSVTWPREP